MADKPKDTYVNSVVTFKGIKKNVYSKIDGSLVGYMKDGQFIQTIDKLPVEKKKEPKKPTERGIKFAEKQKVINALQSIPALEQDAMYYKDQAESVNNTAEERKAALDKYNALQVEIEKYQTIANKTTEKIEAATSKEQGISEGKSLKEQYQNLKEKYDVLLDPTDPEGRGPAIKKQMDQIAEKFQDAYSKQIGTRISLAVAKSQLSGAGVPTFKAPGQTVSTSSSLPSGADIPPASSMQESDKGAIARGEEALKKEKSKADGQQQSSKTSASDKTKEKVPPAKTKDELKADALAAAADLSLPETLFKHIPSLNNLLKRYSDPKLGMTNNQFLKELRNDPWYKQNSAEIKNRFIQKYNYEDLVATGQATGSTDYEKQIDTLTRNLEKRAKAMGSAAASDPAALRRVAENMYITNQGIDDAMTVDFLAAAIRPVSGMIGGKVTEGYTGDALRNYQTLQAAAKANGFSVADIIPGGQNEQQVLAGIANGSIDVNRIAQDARKLAAQGQPQYVRDLLGQGYNLDQVYAPYRQTMANILEIGDPNQIDLNDPTLRSAITDKGDMNLYDFKKALRQDNRWQYTDSAKQEVSTAALNVLRDFGFQG